MSIFKYIKNFILTYGIFSTSLSHAADISSAGVFSGTDSSTYLGYYYGYYFFSQKGTFIGVVTGGTGVFAGITGTVQDSDFYGNNGVMTGSYVANYSNIVSPVPLPGSFGQFGIALISLVGLGLKRVQHSNKA